MCAPVIAALPYIMTAASVAGTALQIKQQNDYADEMTDAANQSAALDKGLIAGQQQDLNDQAAHEKLQRQLQTARERGRIAVAQGYAGVGGNSALMEAMNADLQGAYDVSVIESNRRVNQASTVADGMKVNANLKSRLNEANSYRTTGLGAGLKILGAGADGYMSGSTLKQTYSGN